MFGKRLAQARKFSGFTQEELAKRLDVSKGSVAMWETDKREPSLLTIKKLSVLLNHSVDWLLQDY